MGFIMILYIYSIRNVNIRLYCENRPTTKREFGQKNGKIMDRHMKQLNQELTPIARSHRKINNPARLF